MVYSFVHEMLKNKKISVYRIVSKRHNNTIFRLKPPKVTTKKWIKKTEIISFAKIVPDKPERIEIYFHDYVESLNISLEKAVKIASK